MLTVDLGVRVSITEIIMSNNASEPRPAIPADIRRRVLVEAGHRCAIPACRHIEVEVHHITPWSKCREHKYENLIALCPNCHTRADRGDIDRKSLRLHKFNLRFAHDRFSQFELDVLFEANKGQDLQWPSFMNLSIKRLVDAGFVKIIQEGPVVFVSGMSISPVSIRITDKGRQFIQDIGSREM